MQAMTARQARLQPATIGTVSGVVEKIEPKRMVWLAPVVADEVELR